MAKMNVKKGDLVEVLSGKDKGTQGEVKRVYPAEGRVVVEGVAMVKKAMRPNQMNQSGGIVSQEAAIDASNVALVCPSCNKPTRVGHSGTGKDKVRVCKKCGNEF
ncbi:MAG: 50S ribosomal protein L24 [Atopobiaceae bacterium]|nr:50S ribosomal protein L24 [Atopobiaceae bacterium]